MLIHIYVFLLVVCLSILLALLWRHNWFHRRPASWTRCLPSLHCDPGFFRPHDCTGSDLAFQGVATLLPHSLSRLRD